MKKVLLIMATVLLVGCSSTTTVPKQKSNLTVGMIKSQVVKGETNQATIMRIFGAPNMVTKNRDNLEVWNYSKMSTDNSQESNFFSLFVVGNQSSMSTRTTSSFDWIITFDDHDVVKDYTIISSNF